MRGCFRCHGRCRVLFPYVDTVVSKIPYFDDRVCSPDRGKLSRLVFKKNDGCDAMGDAESLRAGSESSPSFASVLRLGQMGVPDYIGRFVHVVCRGRKRDG